MHPAQQCMLRQRPPCPQVARAGPGAARFRFDDICGHPLGPADYFALAQAFQTVLITDVPDFSLQVLPQANLTVPDEDVCKPTCMFVSMPCMHTVLAHCAEAL